jgi:hypothetical protein
MFYVLVVVWFVVCLIKCFISPQLRRSIVTLILTCLVASVIIYSAGSTKWAGIVLAAGFISPAIRLTADRLNHTVK